MTFPLQRALALAMRQRFDNPTPNPTSGGFPPTEYLPGWFVPFNDSNSFDAASSVDYYFEPQSATPGQRSIITPLRSNSGNYLNESWDGSPLGNYALVEYLTGDVSIVTSGGSDPAITGPTLDLYTGNTSTAVAGVQRTLGTIGGNFSWSALLRNDAGSQHQDDALNIMVQNDAGKVCHVRYCTGNVYHSMDGAMRSVIAHGPTAFWESWARIVPAGGGNDTFEFYAGTQLVYSRTGVLPTSMLSNNMIYLSQQSGQSSNRRGQIAQIAFGSDPRATVMQVCSNLQPQPAASSPTVGYLAFTVEDVDLALLDGSGNVVGCEAFMCRNNKGTWISSPLANLGQCGWGDIDNTKPKYLLVADAVPFTGAAGTGMRWLFKNIDGHMLTLSAAGMFWDYA